MRQIRQGQGEVELCTTAWAKMYESIISFDLLPASGGAAIGHLGTGQPAVGSVHLCEAPGAFISATNHYIKTHRCEGRAMHQLTRLACLACWLTNCLYAWRKQMQCLQSACTAQLHSRLKTQVVSSVIKPLAPQCGCKTAPRAAQHSVHSEH